jgi:hypothetical protein
VALRASSSVQWWIMRAPSGGPLRDATSESFRCFNPSVFALLLGHLGTSVTGKFARIWEFRFSPFADHIRALTESFDSELSWCGEPLSSATR